MDTKPRNAPIRGVGIVGIVALTAGIALTACQSSDGPEVGQPGRTASPDSSGGSSDPSDGSDDQVSGPVEVAPPEGAVLEASYQVREGFQVYECESGKPSLRAPKAELVNEDGQTIQHSADQSGASWQSDADGSKVTAKVEARSPRENAIPELLLQVQDRSGGDDSELGGIDFIQRLATDGGVAPDGECEEGDITEVPYEATYLFWRAD